MTQIPYSMLTDKQKEVQHAKHKEWYKRNKERVVLLGKNLKKEVMAHYGGHCVCCGEDCLDFLTLDHINNDGAIQRRTRKLTGWNLYRHMVKKNDYPDDLQLLCMNCNWGKRWTGVCPHKTMRLRLMERIG